MHEVREKQILILMSAAIRLPVFKCMPDRQRTLINLLWAAVISTLKMLRESHSPNNFCACFNYYRILNGKTN